MDLEKFYIDSVFGGCEKISLLELVKIQARVLVPVVRAMRKELGAERANAIIAEALREWSREIYRRIGAETAGTAGEKFDRVMGVWMPKIGGDVDVEPIRQTPEHYDFNVTGCRYADFFRALGEPELGALIACESDIHLTEQVGKGEIKFERTQTIMKGGKYCDFRWSMKRDANRQP